MPPKTPEGDMPNTPETRQWVSTNKFVFFKQAGDAVQGQYIGSTQQEGMSEKTGKPYLRQHILLQDDGQPVIFNHSHGLSPLFTLPMGTPVRITMTGMRELPEGKRVKELEIEIPRDLAMEILSDVIRSGKAIAPGSDEETDNPFDDE